MTWEPINLEAVRIAMKHEILRVAATGRRIYRCPDPDESGFFIYRYDNLAGDNHDGSNVTDEVFQLMDESLLVGSGIGHVVITDAGREELALS